LGAPTYSSEVSVIPNSELLVASIGGLEAMVSSVHQNVRFIEVF